jgi:hypothetical protein
MPFQIGRVWSVFGQAPADVLFPTEPLLGGVAQREYSIDVGA